MACLFSSCFSSTVHLSLCSSVIVHLSGSFLFCITCPGLHCLSCTSLCVKSWLYEQPYMNAFLTDAKAFVIMHGII